MRRRVRSDEAPPAELLAFPGDRYFDDGAEVWQAKLQDWLAAREAWAAARGFNLDDAFPLDEPGIPDAPLDVADL